MPGRSPGVRFLGAVILSMLLFTGIGATDLPLQEAIQRALAHGYGLQAVARDSAAAADRFQAARTLRFPTLSLDARSSYVSYVPTLALPFKTMELGSKENYQADFKLSLPLYTGGRLSHTIAVARETSYAESSRLEAERMAVAVQTRRAYFNLMLAASSADIAAASLKRLTIIRANVQNLYDNGLADSVDILDAEASVVRAGRIADQAVTGRRNAATSLATLVGMDDDGSIRPTEPLSLSDTTGVAAMTASPEITRAELRRFDHLIAASDQTAALAGTDYFPRLAGFGGYSVGKPNKDLFNKTWNDYLSVGLSLNWELNLGGKTCRNASAARQAAQSARMSRQSLQEAFTLQATTALNSLKQTLSVVAATATEYDIAVRKFELARQKQIAGELTVNRLLEMETDLTVSEQQYKTAVIQYYLARTDYLYAIGSPEIYGGLR